MDISLRHQALAEHKIVRAANAAKRIVVSGLRGVPQGLYRMEIDPPAYLPSGRFVSMKADGFTDEKIVFSVDPRKVVTVDFPKYSDLDSQPFLRESENVLGFEGMTGWELYRALDNIRKAGTLNIAAKSRFTPLSNGKTVLDYIQILHELRGDRFFATVPKELREETKNSVADGLFQPVSRALHHPPEGFAGFTDAGSFKTNDSYGNLQLTFFMKGDECLADIDIDDAGGLGHVFQVLRNTLTGRPTHPYDIHDILIHHQKIDPWYTFRV